MVEYLEGSSLSTSYNTGLGSVTPIRLLTPLTIAGVRSFIKLTEFGHHTKCLDSTKCLTEFGEILIKRRKISNEGSSLGTSYIRIILKYGHFNSPYIIIENFNNNLCNIDDVGNVNTIQIGL